MKNNLIYYATSAVQAPVVMMAVTVYVGLTFADLIYWRLKKRLRGDEFASVAQWARARASINRHG